MMKYHEILELEEFKMRRVMKTCLTVIGVLAVSIILLAGCSSAPISYDEKHFDVSATEIETMNIDVKDRKIEFFPSEDEQIHLTYFENEKEFYTIEQKDGTLSMVCTDAKQWSDYIGKNAAQKHRTIQIHLPEQSIDNLTLKTTNEDIVLPALSLSGSVTINTNQGNIELERLDVGNTVTLESKNGDINGSILGTYDDFSIESETKKGKTNLPPKKETGPKHLSVRTNNGDINLEFEE